MGVTQDQYCTVFGKKSLSKLFMNEKQSPNPLSRTLSGKNGSKKKKKPESETRPRPGSSASVQSSTPELGRTPSLPPELPVLRISRNKHWRYVSSFHVGDSSVLDLGTLITHLVPPGAMAITSIGDAGVPPCLWDIPDAFGDGCYSPGIKETPSTRRIAFAGSVSIHEPPCSPSTHSTRCLPERG